LGKGVPKSSEQAGLYLTEAANLGDAEAQFHLGKLHYGGEGVVQHAPEAVKWFQLSAAQDYAKAKYWFAFCLQHGLGIDKDTEKAKSLYQSAADQHLPEAWIQLGHLHAERGELQTAFAMYLKAAHLGNEVAQTVVGIMCYSGLGVVKDPTKAVRWLQVAAEKGHPAAIYHLGLCYERGLDTLERNVAKATHLYLIAGKQRYHKAWRRLGFLCEHGSITSPQSLKQAAEYYLKAVELGDGRAANMLGGMYLEGRGVEKNSTKAMVYFRKAAEQGIPAAQYNLAYCYQVGGRDEVNATKAAQLLSLAAAQGLEPAKLSLSCCYAQGRGVPENCNTAMQLLTELVDNNYEPARTLKEQLRKLWHVQTR
jgi:TPR repeat protein